MNNCSSEVLGKIITSNCENDNIIVSVMKANEIEESLELLRSSFRPFENLAIATDLSETELSRNDYDNLCKSLIADGVSLVAKDLQANKIIALTINRIVLPPNNPDMASDIEFKSESMQSVMKCLIHMESKFDLFKNWNVDCVFELVMITTHPEYREKKIGMKIAELTMELARKLNRGYPIKSIPNNLQKYRPKGIYSVFTSIYSQKLGANLGLQTLVSEPYESFEYNGIKFSERIDTIHKNLELAGMKF